MSAQTPPSLGRTRRAREIREFLIKAVKVGQSGFIAEASEQFGVSRQTIHRHLSHLVEEGYLITRGPAGRRTYHLGQIRQFQRTYDLNAIDEGTVYRRDFSFVFEGLPQNVIDICHYGFTEMVNNAIDHSAGTQVSITADRNESDVLIVVHDNGEGIFKRIARIMGLPDPRESIFELHKGKLTTDPENHTGEGVFFSSRMFDLYVISSGDLAFVRQAQASNKDVLSHDKGKHDGTVVMMQIDVDSAKTKQEVFEEFAAGDDYQFDKTIVPVRLALYEGDQLISRSQARRILSRVERFRLVLLDFEGVLEVGRSFVDETFRVWAREHPQVQLTAINANKEITGMIEAKRAEADQ